MQDKDVGFLAVVAVGAALFVLFTGAGVTLAVGNTVPTEFWSAASSLSGALVGLLGPQPATRGTLQRRAAEERDAATTMANDPTAPAGRSAALTATAEATSRAADSPNAKSYDIRIILLSVVGLLALCGGVALVLTVGKHTATATTAYDMAVKNAADTLIALGSGAAGALVGLLAPAPGQNKT